MQDEVVTNDSVEESNNCNTGEPGVLDNDQDMATATETTAADSSEGELSLEEQLEVLRSEAKENHGKYLRALADFDNLRRRSQRERESLLKYGTEDVLKELLPVLDSFEKALDHSSESETSGNSDEFIGGVKLVKKQLWGALEKHGLSAMEACGQPFDPNFHQALSRIEKAGVKAETVEEEFVKGYLLHDRLLRAAMVSVSVPGSDGE